MLTKCAEGHKTKLKTHFRIVFWNGKTYTSLPKHDNIEVGHIRSMVRFFGIMECAKTHLPILAPKSPTK